MLVRVQLESLQLIRRTNPEAAAFCLPPIGAERLQERFTGHLVLRLETWIGTGILQETTKSHESGRDFTFMQV
ncbi:hypothetical protein PDJAM_G00232860 [Pangasius djambal]|uniref:Uncharacterized protein n=1 Tax=Pangasius djambal TaxID=1691987 RepID=A0ACC5YEZ5_9TELE|nr:hypothetical protein [Pangasius djambal]